MQGAAEQGGMGGGPDQRRGGGAGRSRPGAVLGWLVAMPLVWLAATPAQAKASPHPVLCGVADGPAPSMGVEQQQVMADIAGDLAAGIVAGEAAGLPAPSARPPQRMSGVADALPELVPHAHGAKTPRRKPLGLSQLGLTSGRLASSVTAPATHTVGDETNAARMKAIESLSDGH